MLRATEHSTAVSSVDADIHSFLKQDVVLHCSKLLKGRGCKGLLHHGATKDLAKKSKGTEHCLIEL